MYEDDFEDEDGLSLLDIIKISIGRNKIAKIRFCIITISLIVITYLAVGVFYNNYKTNYIASFQYQIPSMIQKENEDGIITSVSYLDGTPFNVNSLVTLENLRNVKKSNDDFSNIDVEKMFDNTDVTASFSGTGDYQYLLSIKKSYFKDANQAKLFFASIINLPLDNSKTLVKSTNNSLYLEHAVSDGLSLTEEIDNLINQANHITNTYNNLVTTASQYGKYKVMLDGKLIDINEMKVVAQSKIDVLHLDLYINEVESNHYVRNLSDQKVRDKIQETYNNLVAAQAELDQKINNYNSMIQAGTMLNANYNNYIYCMDKKVEVDYNVEVYKGYLDNGIESPEFEAKLNEIVNILRDITEELTFVQKEIYQEELNTIFYEYNSVVTEAGKLSSIIVIAVSVVVGLVIAAIVNLVLGYSKYKNEKNISKSNQKENLEEAKTE